MYPKVPWTWTCSNPRINCPPSFITCENSFLQSDKSGKSSVRSFLLDEEAYQTKYDKILEVVNVIKTILRRLNIGANHPYGLLELLLGWGCFGKIMICIIKVGYMPKSMTSLAEIVTCKAFRLGGQGLWPNMPNLSRTSKSLWLWVGQLSQDLEEFPPRLVGLSCQDHYLSKKCCTLTWWSLLLFKPVPSQSILGMLMSPCL